MASKRAENRNKLTEALQLGKIHCERMSFAWHKIHNRFPLPPEIYQALEPEESSFFDQLIFRFSKLQDCMGGKLFPSLLENLDEEIREKPFIDILTRLEELNILKSKEDWLLLRETRNTVTHEYPFITDEVIEGLNLLNKHYKLILSIWNDFVTYIDKRFQPET
ncbi:hypothetical protein [Prolixibacter sp. NT017]|uniref:hypothetical protein n=1 Tax=Prolixibacter sp. NT017 TaxID=2652390 RepID=UPI0012796D68|nr:hypothetical protein [Prolixibacter sp. NT017]GET24203.1 hypothetical protein NT017_05320 [Prolixibacter sp. NT017]